MSITLHMYPGTAMGNSSMKWSCTFVNTKRMSWGMLMDDFITCLHSDEMMECDIVELLDELHKERVVTFDNEEQEQNEHLQIEE